MTNSFLYDLVHEMYAYSDEYEPPKDKIFEAEAEVIRSAAKKGNCVIVGRCADAILKDDPDCIGIFLSAPLKTRIQTVMKEMVWMKKRQNAGLNRLTEDVQTITDTIREEYGDVR